MRSYPLSLTAATATLAGITGTTLACGHEDHTLRELVEESELVFRGTVQNIQYANSQPTGQEQSRVAHTFVTYRVDEVLHGQQTGLSVTLRFIGGFDAESMTVMGASEVPEFDLGDSDILFVRGNTTEMCPLVGYHDGRIRLVDGQAYSETGRAMIIDEQGELATGAQYRLPEVQSITVMGRVFERQMGPDALDLAGQSEAIGAEDLADWIGQIAAPLLASPKAFVSADPNVPFAGPDLTPAPAPAQPDAPDAPDQLDDNDVELPESEGDLPAKKD